jgi:hypothetical protein
MENNISKKIIAFATILALPFTPMSFAIPIAFLIALFREGVSYSLFILVVGIVAWLVTFIVGRVRPDAI